MSRYFYTSAPAAAEAFNLNGIASNPPAYHGSIVFGLTDHLELYPEDREGQIYTIEPRDPQRVTISSAGGIVPYTSPLQEEDRVIGFTVDGYQGLELHLKLIDPPDTAPYAPDVGWDNGQAKKLPYEANDNAESLTTADVGLSLSPTGPWAKRLNVTPGGAAGTATVYLQVTDRYAGDNYQVEVMKCVPAGCGAMPSFPGAFAERVVGLSPIFTAWKRIHIERDNMFRKGGVLADDYIPDPNQACGTAGNPMCDCIAAPSADCCQGIGPVFCNQIVSYEWQNAVAGDQVAVFGEVLTFEKAAEVRTVTAVSPSLEHGLARVTLSTGLGPPYEASLRYEPDPPEKYQPTFSNHKSAGFGVISNCDAASNQINAPNSCFHQVDLRDVERAYNDAFVEVYAPRLGMSSVPYLTPTFFDAYEMASGGTCAAPKTQPRGGYDADPWVYFAETWFEMSPRSNYFWFAGVGSTAPLKEGSVECTVCQGQSIRPQIVGSAFPWPDRKTYVFTGGLEAFCAAPSQTATAIQGTTNHELGHQFFVNAAAASLHDDRCQWTAVWVQECNTAPITCAHKTDACLMNHARDRWDTDHRFDRFDLFCGDPGYPNGTAGCCVSCTLEGNGSIRQLQDPIPGG